MLCLIRRRTFAASSAAMKDSLNHTKLKNKVLLCNSATEMRMLFERPGSEPTNAMACARAVKRLGEIKNEHPQENRNEEYLSEQNKALQAIYRCAEKEEFLPREIARFVHKLALFQLDREMPQFMLKKLHDVDDYEAFTSVELSNLAWTMAKYKLRDDLWFEKTETNLQTRKMDGFVPDNVSNLMWSFAILNYRPSEEVLHKFANQDEHCKSFKLQGLVNFLWAFAKFGVKVPVDAAFQEAKTRDLRKRLRLQSLSNLLWSQAKLGYEDMELTNKILDAYVQNFSKPGEYFPPLALTNTLVGLSVLFPSADLAWEGREELKSALTAAISATPQEFDAETQAAIKALGLEPTKK